MEEPNRFISFDSSSILVGIYALIAYLCLRMIIRRTKFVDWRYVVCDSRL